MKTAKQKYETANEKGEVVKVTAKGRMYISSPREIAEIIKEVPMGSVITVADIMTRLAHEHKADYTCPLTTGIFIPLIANYAEEQGMEVPYWRVVKVDGQLYDHYLKQDSNQAERLRAEGWTIEYRGAKRKPVVTPRPERQS